MDPSMKGVIYPKHVPRTDQCPHPTPPLLHPLYPVHNCSMRVEKTSAERVGSPLRLLPGGSGGSSLASGGPVSHEGG